MPRLDPVFWDDLMAYLRHRHATVCRQWFSDLKPIDLDSGNLIVRCENVIQRTYLASNCVHAFNDAALEVTGNLISVRFVTDADLAASGGRRGASSPPPSPASSSTPTPAWKDRFPRSTPAVVEKAPTLEATLRPQEIEQRAVRGAEPVGSSVDFEGFDDQIQISPDYRFDNFIPGPGNELAYAAAHAVASQPGEAYNPLFIHGGVGLGKTHLLQAICQTIIERDPTRRICYLSCDAFSNQFIECVRNNTMNDFRHRYRHVDMLVIDDIHFLSEKERSQEEFFHTFNALYQGGKQIVLSSDSAPSEIPQIEDRLVSRFGWGLVAKVGKPDFETRVAIVKAKAALRDLILPEEVVRFIATKLDSHARELEGAVTTLQGISLLQRVPVTLDLAREALGGVRERGVAQITMDDITEVVSRIYNVKVTEMQSKRRFKSITEPRQICMWLARRRTRFSLEEIGGYFGGRDHTTVMHSIKTVDDRISSEDRFAQQVEEIESQIIENTGVGRRA